ncbi:unnamed protein product [Sphagnum jensenii]|uniref:t-SNARE coiled-coil homology domain-containing protein n=1 Tax=Sphagnum jensenii TaxID=128206 RepID=A0ABP0W8V2_9BRYO
MSSLDPFYLVKEEILDSVKTLQATFTRWEQLSQSATERIVLSKELLSSCESIEWQVEELDRATGVTERDPARFSIDSAEIERRKQWTASTCRQVQSIRHNLHSATQNGSGIQLGMAMSDRRELMRTGENHLPNSNQTVDDGFLTDESGQQALLMKEQEEDLDDLSETIMRLGAVGLNIHEELSSQGRLIDELGNDMDTTATRLDFVQKHVSMVMKKAGWKGQLMAIVSLVVLLLILTFLIFSA